MKTNWFPISARLVAAAVTLYAVSVMGQAKVETGTGATATGVQGTVLYARIVGEDAGAFGTPEANLMSLMDNDVAITPDPTCSATGTAGELMIIDNDETSVDTWQVCDGTSRGQLLSKLAGAHVTHSVAQEVAGSTAIV